MALSRRDLFDIPEDVAYLNAAYMGPLPKASAAAARAAVDRKMTPWEIKAEDFFSESERLRALAARLFGAEADAVALAPSASYGIALAAKNLPVARGAEILILAEQFPSNVYPWRARAAETGATLRTISRAPGRSWTEAILASLSANTAVLAIPQTHWVDGGAIDLEAVSAALNAHGGALVLDLTQSLGVIPFDAAAARPDFAVAATYKWLLGPYALAFVYAAPDRRGGAPLEHNWITRRGAEDFARLVDYQEPFAAGARRYDMGERASFFTVPAAIASLELLLEIGPASIAAALGETTAEIARRLAPLGFNAEPDELRSPHYLGLTAPAGAPADLAERLARDNVYVSQRGARLRVTPHIHVTETDIDRLEHALRMALA